MSEEITSSGTWLLTLEGSLDSPDDDIELKFTDTSNILGEPTMDRTFIDRIIQNTAEYEHYSLFKNLKKIISDSGADVTNLAIWALLGVVKENNQKVGFLLGGLSDGSVHIIAVWPTTFVNQLRAEPALFEEVLEQFVSNPDFWSQVDLIIGYG